MTEDEIRADERKKIAADLRRDAAGFLAMGDRLPVTKIAADVLLDAADAVESDRTYARAKMDHVQ